MNKPRVVRLKRKAEGDEADLMGEVIRMESGEEEEEEEEESRS